VKINKIKLEIIRAFIEHIIFFLVFDVNVCQRAV